MNFISIKITNKEPAGHNDIEFSIGEISGYLRLDSYYFIIAIENEKTINTIPLALAKLFTFWKSKIIQMENNQIIFLPIEFADQYTRCLKVKKNKLELILEFGLSRIEGYSINPLNPEHYYQNVTDFKSNSLGRQTIPTSTLVDSLDTQIKQLTECL